MNNKCNSLKQKFNRTLYCKKKDRIIKISECNGCKKKDVEYKEYKPMKPKYKKDKNNISIMPYSAMYFNVK